MSRVLSIKGPKDGKYWLEIQNGHGQIIGQGAVKPAGEPEASISIALPIHDARAMALAIIEYMAAYRVAQVMTGHRLDLATPVTTPSPSQGKGRGGGGAQDQDIEGA